MRIEIKSRWNAIVLFCIETDSLRLAVEAAVKGDADLRGADLRGAYLGGAYLGGAYLRGAYLGGAYLRGAKLRAPDGTDLVLIGERPYLVLGPLGSRADYLHVWITDRGVYVRAGCFWDTLDAFREAVAREHGGSAHAIEYAAAVALIECHAAQWPAEQPAEASA